MPYTCSQRVIGTEQAPEDPGACFWRQNGRAMAAITDKGMQAKPGTIDKWLIESGARGEGRLVGRITPKGERRFYFRYTDSIGSQVRLLVGTYDSRGDALATFTVQQARDKARDLSGLYRSGVRDLRRHFAQQQADAMQAEDDARQAAAAARREAAKEWWPS